MHTGSGSSNCADGEQVLVKSDDEGTHAENEVSHHDEDWRREAQRVHIGRKDALVSA